MGWWGYAKRKEFSEKEEANAFIHLQEEISVGLIIFQTERSVASSIGREGEKTSISSALHAV